MNSRPLPAIDQYRCGPTNRMPADLSDVERDRWYHPFVRITIESRVSIVRTCTCPICGLNWTMEKR